MFRKVLFLFIFCFNCFFSYSQDFKVLSFNLGANSSRHRANDTEWIEDIAEIIKMSDSDIVLLQEAPIQSESDIRGEFLRVLKDKLKLMQSYKSWESISTYGYLKNKENPNKTPSFTMNNAILFNSNIFMAYLNGRYPINFKDDQCFSNYQTRFNNLQLVQFSFKSSPNNKFYMINVHTYFSNPDSDLKIIGKIIRDYCKNKSFIVAGDFNKSITDVYNIIKSFCVNEIFIDGEKNHLDFIGLKTSIGKKGDSNGLILSNDYDHFLYSGKIQSNEKIQHVFSNTRQDFYVENSIQIGNKQYNNNKNNFKEDISDHLPIVMTFKYVNDKIN